MMIGIVVVCVVVGLLVASCKEKRATPSVTEIVNPEETRAKADRGDAEAQWKLGTVYAKGQNVKQDYKEAAKWYRLAADQGDVRRRSSQRSPRQEPSERLLLWDLTSYS